MKSILCEIIKIFKYKIITNFDFITEFRYNDKSYYK
jgi:hypothetical protein